MKYNKIPNTEITVSKLCLGTMTFGEQNSQEEAHEQLNYALEKGVNFIDTAEMYSVPGRQETQGKSEEIIGNWLLNQKREDVVVATKITGPNPGLKYIRQPLGFSKKAIKEAIEKSLKRLKTDYIDLYQLHWPERKTNFFGRRNYVHTPDDQWQDNFKEVVFEMDQLVKSGKIRHYGVSNETPWGLGRHLEESKENHYARCVSIQNPYSLLNRLFEVGLAEVSIREKVGLLAYSPLAFGVLSGKYLNGKMPDKSRLQLFPVFSRYNSKECHFLTEQYQKLADEIGISLTQLALAFVNQQPFVTSNIIGATKMHQLKENIESIDIELDKETLKKIDEIQAFQPNPAP